MAMRNIILLPLCLALFLLRASYGSERLVVFGDSLSDIGNSFAATGGQLPPGPPDGTYGETFDGTGALFLGRFTDGRNWVDYFPSVAKHSGIQISAVTAYLQDPNNTNDNATDFAISGSTSGDLNGLDAALPSFPAQISAYLARLGAKSAAEDLCVIWIGANDFAAQINPLKTASNIKDGIAQLVGAGAKNFVVITIPDISLTPQIKAQGGATILAAKRFVFTANLALEVELLRFALLHGISMDLVDINAIFVPIVFEPTRFGFTNSVDFAYEPLTGPLLVTDPNDYVFWDGFHPTTNVHHIAADFIFKAVFVRRHVHEFLSLR